MSARFHAPGAARAGEIVVLPPDEGQHLVRVLRLRAGAAVRVFNGRGAEFDAIVQAIARDGVRVRIDAVRTPAPEAAVAVTLAPAVLKGDKMDDVVRDAVMVGAAAIQPVVTARSEVTPASLARGRRRDRWERIAVASVKQCGRAVLPAILEPCGFEAAIAALAERRLPAPAVMFVEPSAPGEPVPLYELDSGTPTEATILIGPEGGWTPREIAAADGVARTVTLGPRTLRADAVPIVALAALLTHWRAW